MAEQYQLVKVPIDCEGQALFAAEPCEYVKEIAGTLKRDPAPAYFISCYASHPLTEKNNTTLYMLKELQLAGTQPLAFSDTGWISPLVALHWADAMQEDSWFVCMEQLSGYHDPALAVPAAYPLGEALAIGRISPIEGKWSIRCYALEQFSEVVGSDTDSLVERAVRMAEDVLHAVQLNPADVTILPHMVDAAFISGVQSAFPNTMTKRQPMNQGTADLWYTLDELVQTGDRYPHILLLFADPLHGIGCIQLHKEETS